MQEKPIRRKLAVEIKDAEEGTTLAYLIADCLLPSCIGPVVEAGVESAYAPVVMDENKMKTAIDAALYAAVDKLTEMGITDGDSNLPRGQHTNQKIAGL